MFHIIYLSSAVVPFSVQELDELLTKSRTNNLELGITGMLFYQDGNFLQVIEGEEQGVRRLHSKIGRDRRHRGVLTLFQESIPAREFSGWSMAFRDFSRNPDQVPEGYNDILNLERAEMDLSGYSLKVRSFVARFGNR